MFYVEEVFGEINYILKFKNNTVSYKQYQGIYSQQNKRWLGMIGVLERKEADLALGLFTLSLNRSKVIDFTLPMVVYETSIFFKALKNSNIYLDKYVKVSIFDLRGIYIK